MPTAHAEHTTSLVALPSTEGALPGAQEVHGEQAPAPAALLKLPLAQGVHELAKSAADEPGAQREQLASLVEVHVTDG